MLFRGPILRFEKAAEDWNLEARAGDPSGGMASTWTSEAKGYEIEVHNNIGRIELCGMQRNPATVSADADGKKDDRGDEGPEEKTKNVEKPRSPLV